MEGTAPSRRGGMKSRREKSFYGSLGGYSGISEGARAILGEVGDEEREEFVEEEDYGGTEVADAIANAPEMPWSSNLFLSNESIYGQPTQEVTPSNNSKAPKFKNPSRKAPDSVYGTQADKLRVLIQYCELTFHNYAANFYSDRKKALYSTSFPTGRAGKWIEPYLSNIYNEDTSYLLNDCQLFETQSFTLFGDPNEVRKADQELDNLRMKESGHVSLYIAHFRSLMSRIGDWEERAYSHVYRRGLALGLLDQLASLPGTFDTLQALMHITLELDTRYHDRQKEKG
ncbi:hypothetical protein O181_006055 [Austropuccinia psidii MF-1]|uniref:Retrotransposon gag domain-containing protein n=1 Tax=Austropuccinia psidii MF-1 TaxID=1389203 RepID=A0A9Q3BJL8_9BASI|nr:hypothetical protein [Austropuccinia psidii MF-1]